MAEIEEDTKNLKNTCPNCGTRLAKPKGLRLRADQASLSEDKPKPGSWAICHGCYSLFVYGPELQLEWPPPDEDIPVEVDTLRNRLMEFVENHKKQAKS